MRFPENTQGIRLNATSEELECEQSDNNTKVCNVTKGHFSANGSYYIHYLNGDGKLITFYDISPILVSLPKPEKKSNFVGIIFGSVIGGLALIGIIVFLVVRYCRKKKASLEDFPDKEESALIAINTDDD